MCRLFKEVGDSHRTTRATVRKNMVHIHTAFPVNTNLKIQIINSDFNIAFGLRRI